MTLFTHDVISMTDARCSLRPMEQQAHKYELFTLIITSRYYEKKRVGNKIIENSI